MKFNVINTIVQNDNCIGCGVCAGICPSNALSMNFNKYGEYIPFEFSDCLKKCNLCLNICPFYDTGENEDSLARAAFSNIEGIKHRLETGYYLDLYAGYSTVNDHRVNGASGGMATWLLETLLIRNIVDHVVCVTPHSNPEKLFRYAIFDNIEAVRLSAKSAYYPVEMSEIIRQMLVGEGRYAIIGLPCFLKALRLAAKKNKKLSEKIIVTIGLVCGQTKSKYYTTYLASLSGVFGALKKANYRGKSHEKPANNYYFHCVNENDSEGKLFWNEGVSEAWNNGWFTPNACNFCDDVFAEVADVTVMDAWLPEYSRESKGTSMVLSRSLLISDLLRQGREENQITLKSISIENIIQSQMDVLNIKRNQLAYRIYRAKEDGLSIPTKRVAPSKNLFLLSKKEIELKDAMRFLSRDLFLMSYDSEKLDLKVFAEKMRPLLKKIYTLNHLKYILFVPIRAIRKAMEVLFGG